MDYKQKLYELGITLDKSGKQICPQCSASRRNKSDKCLSVSFEHDAVLYHCHHCGWSGSVFYTENKYHKQYNRPAVYETKENNGPLIRYFAKRGISEQTLKKYNVGLGENNTIMFPYYENGILVNIKTRHDEWIINDNGEKERKRTFGQTKDAKKTFYGIDFVKEDKSLIIVEGEIDVLSLAEQGINSVSVPQGGSDKKLECLSNCSDEFIKSFDNYIVAVDKDTTGNGLKEELLKRFPKDKCKLVDWGQYKDANEALIAGEDLHTYIDNAQYLTTDGICSFGDSQVWDKLYSELFERDENYYKTGWLQFDELVKIRTGYLMVISGYPSRGKSYFVNNLLVNLSKRYSMNHLIASFEDTIGSIYTTLFQIYTGKTINKLRNENKEDAIQKILCDENFVFIHEHFKLFDNSILWSIDDIIAKTEVEVIKHGINTLVIDPYNRLKNEYTEREDKYVGSILAKLCALAKRLNILVIFVAHPKKPDTSQKIEAPTMYDISGSSDWYNMADYGIIVHRNRDEVTKELDNTPTIHVIKVKNFSLGNPQGGIVTLRFNKQTMNIVNL